MTPFALLCCNSYMYIHKELANVEKRSEYNVHVNNLQLHILTSMVVYGDGIVVV